MLKILSGFLTGGLILGTATVNYAGPYILREARQQNRVSQGVLIGESTPCELKHLEREQASLKTWRRMAWSDGRLNPWEARHLKWEQDRAGLHIREANPNDYPAW